MSSEVTGRTIHAFGVEVTAIGEALEAALGRADDGESEYLLEQLRSAHEELRVADEELRVQQEEIQRFLAGEQVRAWQQERLLAALPCPVLVTTAEGGILSSNSCAAALLGVPENRLLRRPVQSFVQAQERAAVRRDLSQAVAGEGQFRRSFVLTPRGGQPVPVDAVVLAQRQSVSSPMTVTWLVFAAVPEDRSAPAVAGPARRSPASDTALAEAICSLTQLPVQRSDRAGLLSAAAAVCETALGDTAVVSLTLGHPAGPEEVATTSKVAQLVDGMQIRAAQGPCQRAYHSRQPVFSQRLADDVRWPRLTAFVGDVPVSWALCSPVMLGEDLAGVLNVYGLTPAPPAGYSSTVALLAAAIAAVLHALDVRAELEDTARHLEIGLTSRATIDQAKGIVMATEHCGPDEAFARLVAASTRQNRKLRDVAAALVASTSAATS